MEKVVPFCNKILSLQVQQQCNILAGSEMTDRLNSIYTGMFNDILDVSVLFIEATDVLV